MEISSYGDRFFCKGWFYGFRSLYTIHHPPSHLHNKPSTPHPSHDPVVSSHASYSRLPTFYSDLHLVSNPSPSIQAFASAPPSPALSQFLSAPPPTPQPPSPFTLSAPLALAASDWVLYTSPLSSSRVFFLSAARPSSFSLLPPSHVYVPVLLPPHVSDSLLHTFSTKMLACRL